MRKKIIFWPKTTSILNNEDGMVIIAALMVLVLLTIIGVASTNISNTEVKIATHELIYQQNFYRAEGATMEALEAMENQDNPKTAPPSYLWQDPNTFTKETMPYDSTFWNGTIPASSTLSDTSYAVVYGGIAAGESLEINSTKIHRFGIYGRCAPPNRGAVTVEIGYLKAF